MEALAAGKVEGRNGDGTARGNDGILRGFQILRVEDDKRRGVTLGLPWFAFTKSAVDAGMVPVERDVVRAVILEIPAEGPFVESLGLGDIGSGEFDVIDGVMLRRVGSCALSYAALPRYGR